MATRGKGENRMRKTKAAYMNYVCGRCFHKLHECTCAFAPWTLIMIDEGIQDCVRILNEKGYQTTGCCEGHYGQPTNTGICFNMTYEDLIEAGLPEGFKWIKGRTCLVHLYKQTLDRSAFKVEKQKSLDALLEWCARLPEMRYKANKRGS